MVTKKKKQNKEIEHITKADMEAIELSARRDGAGLGVSFRYIYGIIALCLDKLDELIDAVNQLNKDH